MRHKDKKTIHLVMSKDLRLKGQGIVEYCLILVLASVALVAALGVFGSALTLQFDNIINVVTSL